VALLTVYEAVAWLRDRGENFDRGSFARLFADVHAVLRSYARELAGGGDPAPGLFGTTLLVAVDTGDELAAAYAGNGAIWHIRGNLDRFPSPVLRNAVNPLGGREGLYDMQEKPVKQRKVPSRKASDRGDRLGIGEVRIVERHVEPSPSAASERKRVPPASAADTRGLRPLG
jgi:hypothetical protein